MRCLGLGSVLLFMAACGGSTPPAEMIQEMQEQEEKRGDAEMMLVDPNNGFVPDTFERSLPSESDIFSASHHFNFGYQDVPTESVKALTDDFDTLNQFSNSLIQLEGFTPRIDTSVANLKGRYEGQMMINFEDPLSGSQSYISDLLVLVDVEQLRIDSFEGLARNFVDLTTNRTVPGLIQLNGRQVVAPLRNLDGSLVMENGRRVDAPYGFTYSAQGDFARENGIDVFVNTSNHGPAYDFFVGNDAQVFDSTLTVKPDSIRLFDYIIVGDQRVDGQIRILAAGIDVEPDPSTPETVAPGLVEGGGFLSP